jgi:hypothetical protein
LKGNARPLNSTLAYIVRLDLYRDSLTDENLEHSHDPPTRKEYSQNFSNQILFIISTWALLLENCTSYQRSVHLFLNEFTKTDNNLEIFSH